MKTVILGLPVVVFAGLSALSSQDPPFKPGKLPKEEVDALRPGLVLKLFPGDGAGKALDVRVVRLAALYVPEGQTPSVMVPPGFFSATLAGYLKVALRGDFQFRLEVKGTALLEINNKEVFRAKNKHVVSETIELAKGYNKVYLTFRNTVAGDASVRIWWKGEDFAWEPLPPHQLFTRGDLAELVQHEKVREGRHLFGRLECAHCHALPDGMKVKDCALPELHHRAPLLTSAGHRLREAWLAHWIENPKALRPEATMPRLLGGPEAPQQAADIAAYLLTLKDGTAPKPTASDETKLELGEKLFGTLGCVACHRLEEPAAEDKFGRLSLFHVGAKYGPGALEAFLRQPHENYLWSRMPDFKLKAEEAAALACFLLDRAKGTIEAKAKGDAAHGKKLYETAGCVRCHGLTIEEAQAVPVVPAAGKDKLDGGCLAEEKAGRAPDFGFDVTTRLALQEFLRSDPASLRREVPAEFSRRQMDSLQCLACHRRDGVNSRWQRIREDEGELGEILPILTWAGEKLKPEWTQKLLRGEHDHGARPWIKARMPAFPARADMVALGLSHEHGLGEKEDEAPPHDPKLAAIGEKLLPQMNGFNCVMCHGVGDQKALAPFEAPGINLLDAAYRIRHPYYQRWMLDPPRLDPLTRMPKLAPDGKTTPLPVFDGDAARQFGSIWHYMQTLPKKK